MNRSILCLALSSMFVLTACQTTPRQYNGSTGYQIENQTKTSATLAYTLASRPNQQLDERKLQRACQNVLGAQKVYKLSVLSINEISNPAQQENYGVQLGQTRASFGLSNTPSLNNGEDYATRQALEARPSTLKVVRYTCS
ncbi:hypothetical protein I5515_03840 [Acinetobacter calcoaceticus]|uniref:hypothetical protein n=1 Tax=Acinetobacter calcoaceticus TaxID=471 RepID=UPI0019016801|nr:hypothetical protein [Acinetobacter calcoaceticus]MBJ9720930.1 hypothetical protein [Acinetobacter calcoaceticus]